MYSEFIPNKISDFIELDDMNYNKVFYDLVDEFNQITKNKERCYVLTLSNRVNIDFCPVRNGIYYPGKDSDYLIIYEKYYTKNQLLKIKQKYFPNEVNNFEVVYAGGNTRYNMVEGRINDKRNRLDSR